MSSDPGISAAREIGLCGKFSMGLYDEFQKNSCNFGAAARRRRTDVRQDVAELDAIDLKPAFGSWETMGGLRKS
jgi:hypothetical protein